MVFPLPPSPLAMRRCEFNDGCGVCCRRLADKGKIAERVGIKTLTDVEANTVLEVLAFKKTETRNGEAVALTVILPEHASSRGETTLFVPIRFLEECERKVPCLLYYGGVKSLDGGKRCHDVKLITPDDGSIFHDSDDEGVADDEWSGEDDEESKAIEAHMLSIDDFLPTCLTCGQSADVCTGRCSRCNAHQPLDGGQCHCR